MAAVARDRLEQGAAERFPMLGAAQPDGARIVGQQRGQGEDREAHGHGPGPVPPPEHKQHQAGGGEAKDRRRQQPPLQAFGIGLAPRHQRSDTHQQDNREKDRHHHGVEIRRPDRDLGSAQGLERQRVERAQEHAGAGEGEGHVVPHEQRLARQQRRDRLLRALVAPERHEDAERRDEHDAHEPEDIRAAPRINGEGVHR